MFLMAEFKYTVSALYCIDTLYLPLSRFPRFVGYQFSKCAVSTITNPLLLILPDDLYSLRRVLNTEDGDSGTLGSLF